MRRKKSHAGAIVLTIIAIAAIAIALLIMFAGDILPIKDDSVPANAPVTFAGPSMLLTLSGGNADNSAELSLDGQKAAFSAAADFAKDKGFAAIMYEGSAASGEKYYRKGDGEVSADIKKYDKLLNKWDPLRYLCQEAAKRGIGVMVYFAPESISAQDAASLAKAYPVAGVYSYTAGQGAFAGYEGLDGESRIDALTAASTFPLAASLMREDGFTGLVLGEYSTLAHNIASVSMYAALFNESATAFEIGFTPKAELALSYPTDTTAKIYSSKCFIMGSSDANLPLTLNGAEVPRTGDKGSFGILADLALGENSFELSQGESSLHFVLTHVKSSGGGSGTMSNDNTQEVPAGTMVEIATGIASALTDPASDDNINETVKQGARVSVTNCVRTVRGGKHSWAYQIASGDYVLARNVKVLPAPTPAAFTAATVEKTDIGEIVRFEGSGSPLAYTLREDNILTLTFYDASFAEGFSIVGSDFITSVKPSATDGGTVLELGLNAANPLWGWDIRYKDGTTQLFLKKAPVQSTDFAKPLQGVRVLLDAGHGDQDGGAMGTGGLDAPCEKDVNLALAMSAKSYLEKLGATVLATRTDDTFKTLDERLAMTNDEAPDFFISVHHNAVEMTQNANESSGTECYYFYKWHSALADSLSQLVSEAGGRENRSAKYGYYYVARSTMAPSVLLETGFMANPFEYEKLTDDDVIAAEGAAIAKAVLDNVPLS